MMAPFALVDDLGKAGAYAVYLLVGVAFGATLELAGFARSPKLAAQFYLKDMTVLKVMFTGIVTAMVLIFLASALGLLSYNDLYVNPTYLWPGVVGGLVMGVGFILGGFCPGTSLVAVASLKIDGWFFFLGTMAGILVFEETVGFYGGFWYSSYMGRYTLPELLGLSTGATVLLVVVFAVVAFVLAGKAERAFGDGISDARPVGRRLLLAGGGVVFALALLVAVLGQPSPMQKWERIASSRGVALEERQVQIDAGELIQVASNHALKLVLLDVRDERDFNLFHVVDSRRVDLDEIGRRPLTRELLDEPANAVVILVSNDEGRSTEAWKMLTGEGILNVYILAGGINGWLDRFAVNGACAGCRRMEASPGNDQLRWAFDAALGANRPIADPDLFADKAMVFAPKVKLEVRQRPTGGCG
jgi:rhodanese-related sulfurtransferase